MALCSGDHNILLRPWVEHGNFCAHNLTHRGNVNEALLDPVVTYTKRVCGGEYFQWDVGQIVNVPVLVLLRVAFRQEGGAVARQHRVVDERVWVFG